MLFENYVDLRVYNSQTRISLPRVGPDADGSPMQLGKGSIVYLLTPNIASGLSVLKDDTIGWKVAYYKNFTMDNYFRRRIGMKMFVSNERVKIAKTIGADRDIPMNFYPPLTVKNPVNAKKNMVVDLSRWMEIFFNFKPTNIRKTCEAFISMLKDQLNDPKFAGYKQKLLLIDMNSWATNSPLVLMNRRLLNNPLSLMVYCAYYFPDLWAQCPDVRVMLANRNAHQVLLFQTSYLSKKTYPKIKAKFKLLRDLVISVEDESSDEELTDEEVKAEVVNNFKNDMKKNLKAAVVADAAGKATSAATQQQKPVDLTIELEDDDDDNATSQDDDSDADKQEEDINRAVDDFANNNDVTDVDPAEAAKKVADTVKKNIYVSSFMPKRTPAELEKIKRLTETQTQVLNKTPTKSEAERKKIDTTTYTTAIENNNPNLASSKFKNFDKNYVDKCMNHDIDSMVTGLSDASAKIFVTDREIIDASDPMNLIETWVYTLQDEKGRTKKIKLDVPKVIDGCYVFLNGNQMMITHQFVLKPLVKTDQDTVQIVTAYNKVFIRRAGQVDSNMNNILVYLAKNKGKFMVREGNFSMMNRKYEVPLDYIMVAKRFTEFTIGDIKYSMDIEGLCNYAQTHYKSKYKAPDFTKEIPIGINKKTHELVVLPLDRSYTDHLMRQFSTEDQAKISKNKSKPKLIMANAKMAGKDLPVILFCMYCEGLESVLHKAGVEYKFIEKNEWRKVNKYDWDGIDLEDCTLIWKKKDIATALLMNGLKHQRMNFDNVSKAELESKDTYISLVSSFFDNDARIAYTFDNYRDFLIEAKAKEMLADFGYPTDVVGVFLTAARMLVDNNFLPENNMANMRVRSAEVIADIVYLVMTQAYEGYRKNAHKKNAMNYFTVKQSAVLDGLLRSSANSSKGKRREIVTNLVVPASVLNPVHELEKSRAVTFKGLRGIQLDRAMTKPRRAYDKSMLGTVGITTSPDANVGVVRQLTLEPNITSTRGYIDTSNQDNPDDLNSSQLFTTAELLTPIGVRCDDPDRTSIKSFENSSTLNLVNCWKLLLR